MSKPLSAVVRATLGEDMSGHTGTNGAAKAPEVKGTHEHVAERVHVVLLRKGVPYEVERKVCTACNEILAETPLKRASA